jgi:colanic acid biosynthesis glycosyl transferase WcaI
VGGGMFLLGAMAQIVAHRPRCVLVSTSPPFAPVVSLLCRLLDIPCVTWVMDLNPDQAVALNQVFEHSARVQVFERLNRDSFQASSRVLAMDPAMLSRIEGRYGPLRRTGVVPPWPHVLPENQRSPSESRFRDANGWSEKFLVMYSGNHSPANSLTTVLDVAEELALTHPDIHFAFVGAGGEKAKVEARKLANASSLPYQPFEELEDTLGAADLHLVTMGDSMLGIVHPCKIYNAMAVGRPVLGIAPAGSHVQRILTGSGVGWWVEHGDVNGCRDAILECRALSIEERARMGQSAQDTLRGEFSKDVLTARICQHLEEEMDAGVQNA